MADFTEHEWNRIREKLNLDQPAFGLPKRSSKSVVLASWNIRKFGGLFDSRSRPSRSDGAWQLIAEFCERCDFIAVQEVQDSLESLRSLRDRLGKNYALLVSDIAGGVPGRSGMSACSTL